MCVNQTSAYPLFLSRQDSRSINDTDALQDRIWQLGTHEPVKKTQEREKDSTLRIGEERKLDARCREGGESDAENQSGECVYT